MGTQGEGSHGGAGSGFSPGIQTAGTLGLRLPELSRNKGLLFKPPSLWDSVIAG